MGLLISTMQMVASPTNLGNAQTIAINDAITNTTTTFVTLAHTSTGTAAANFGIRTLYNLEDASANAAQNAASIDAIWSTATHGSETGDLVFSTVLSAGSLTERMRLTSTSTYAGSLILPNTGGFLIKDSAGNIRRMITLDSGNDIYMGNASNTLYVYSSTGGLTFNSATIGSLVVGRTADATSGATIKDSNSFIFTAAHWVSGASTTISATIYHDMITAGAAPRSALKFNVNALDFIYMDNTNGTGTMDFNSRTVSNLVVGDFAMKGNGGDWTLKESEDGIIAVNNQTQRKYKLVMEEL